MNYIQKQLSKKKTENGDVAYSTTGNQLTDLFFMTAYFENHLEQAKIGDSEKEQVFSMFVRDPRFGLGRRDLGRVLMAQSGVSTKNIVKAGRFDDLLFIPTDENLAYLKEQVKENGLAKKWMPRLQSSKKARALAKALCKEWNITEKEYRQLIKTDTTEYKLSYAEKAQGTPLNDLFHQGNYTHPLVKEIDFEQVPSLAMTKYLHCFSTREDIKDRFAEYIKAVKESKAKVNTKTANVHDSYKTAMRGNTVSEIEKEASDVVAKKIEETASLGVEINAIPILDTSGSMYLWSNWRANYPDFTNMNDIGVKAMSVAHAIAKKSTYAPNQVISFSSEPKLMTIHGDTLAEEYKSMYTGDCSNTDFGKVMQLLKKLKAYPQWLIVLSDMEFDYGSNRSKKETMRLFQENGAPTRIIWWTFNDRNKTTPEFDEYGNIFVSGYNLQILKLLETNFDMTKYIDKILEKYKKDIDFSK